MTIYPGGHSPKSGKCHPLRGKPVVIVDVKDRKDLPHIGRSGVILHDSTFDHDYLSFDDGGSIEPEIVIVDVVELECTPCSKGLHVECEDRQQMDKTGPEWTLASAVFGDGATMCCCLSPSEDDIGDAGAHDATSGQAGL